MGEHLQKDLPPLQTVFGEGASYDATSFFSSWQHFLCNRPTGHVSFRKTQSMLPGLSIHVLRTWDIDSIILGLKTWRLSEPQMIFYWHFSPIAPPTFLLIKLFSPMGLISRKHATSNLGRLILEVFASLPLSSFPKPPSTQNQGRRPPKTHSRCGDRKIFTTKL